MTHKSVLQEYPTRVNPQKCPTRASYMSVPQKVFYKSVSQECARVSQKSFLLSYKSRVRGRYLANWYHLNPRGSTDCHRPAFCPLVPYFAQSAGKAKPKQRPYGKSVPTPRGPTRQSRLCHGRHLGPYNHSRRGHEPTQLFLHCRQEGECRDCSQGGRRHSQALHRHSWGVNIRESLTHKLLTENQKLSCSKHLVSQVSQRPESKTKEKAGKRHAHFSRHT